jgi:hypothetical protein
VGVLSTYAIVVSGNIKEANLKRELKDKDDAFETYKLTVEGQVADAKREGIEAGKIAGNAVVRAAGLEKEAWAAKLETEKLKQVVVWRTLSPENAAELLKSLSAHPGSVNLRYTSGDPESLFFAIQLSKTLHEANWQVAPGSENSNLITFGVSLPGASSPDMDALRGAFSAAKIPFATETPPNTGSSVGFNIATIAGAPTLMVGSKPPPILQ